MSKNLKERASFMLRGKKGGTEYLIARNLMQGIASPPVRRIRLTCEAAFMLDQEQLERLGIDLEKLNTLYAVASSLSNFAEEDHPMIGWSFSETKDSFEKYIAPWSRDPPSYNSFYLASAMGDSPAFDLGAGGFVVRKDYLKGLECWDAFFFVTTMALTWSGLRKLENEFSSWAMPEIQRIAAKISNIIPSAILEFARAEVESEGKEKEEGDEEEEVEEE